MQTNSFNSLYKTYQICIKIAKNHANDFRNTILFYIFAYIAQGFAFAFFYPFIDSLLKKDFLGARNWFFVIFICFLINAFLKFKASYFDHAKTPKTADINHDTRVEIGKKLRLMPLEKLYTYRTGELNSILSSGVEESVMMMGFIFGMLLEAIIIPAMIVVSAFFIDYRLGLTLLAIFCIMIPLYKLNRKLSIIDKTNSRNANETLESDVIEYIQGIQVLKSLNLIGKNQEKLNKSIEVVKVLQDKSIFKTSFINIVVGIGVDIAIFVCLFFGLYLVLNFGLNIAILITLIAWIVRVYEPLQISLALSSIADVMDTSFTNITKLLEIEDLKILPKTKNDDKSFDIKFENVNFSYEGSNSLAIKDINFTIAQKTFTAIVGDSGSGKTTIIKLLMRYADPQTGVIKIGSQDIRQMSANELMSQISVVFQDVYLFDDTIFNNIKMANENATDEEVKNAAMAAFCHEFIEKLPNGYETKVGEIGGTLSGGEKQRISIARAILKKSSIIILDEPTSALDTQSEVAVQKAINSLVKDKTIIVIAHRLSTIRAADQILVMQDNTIVQCANHETLATRDGKYKNMLEASNIAKEWGVKTF